MWATRTIQIFSSTANYDKLIYVHWILNYSFMSVLTFGQMTELRIICKYHNPDLPANACLVPSLTPSEGNGPWTIMSSEITLWIEKPTLHPAQFLLLAWENWAEGIEDKDNLNSGDRVEGSRAGGSQRYERWERHNYDGLNGEYYGARLFQEWEHWRRGNGRQWLTSCRKHSASNFWSMRNWVGFTSPSLFYPARRRNKQYNKFVTVAAQCLSADGMYRTRVLYVQ